MIQHGNRKPCTLLTRLPGDGGGEGLLPKPTKPLCSRGWFPTPGTRNTRLGRELLLTPGQELGCPSTSDARVHVLLQPSLSPALALLKAH